MATTSASREYAETTVMISLAGPVAQRLALQIGSDAGWRRWLTADELKAHHEAGHAVVAWSFGRYIYEMTISEHRAAKRSESYGGYAAYGTHPQCTSAGTVKITHDGETIAGLCALLAPDTGWRSMLATVRGMRARTSILVKTHWLKVVHLSGELIRYKTLDQQRIERILKPRGQ